MTVPLKMKYFNFTQKLTKMICTVMETRMGRSYLEFYFLNTGRHFSQENEYPFSALKEFLLHQLFKIY